MDNKIKIRVGLILVMSVLVMCTLAVPAIAKNIPDAEGGTGFGAMSPEITEIPVAKGVNMPLEGAGTTVIWQDYFSTNPWSRWSYDLPIGWSSSGDYVYLPYWYDANHFTCAANMWHDFSTNPFYGYYNPKIKYTFISYSDNNQDAEFVVGFLYKSGGQWYWSDWDQYVSPDEYSSWTTKTLDLNDYWTYDNSVLEGYRVRIYMDADNSHDHSDGTCDPWSEVKGHVKTAYIALIGTPNDYPNKPSNPSPANGATGVSTTTDLSWTGGDPNGDDTVTYDVYFGTSPASLNLICEDISSTTCDPGALNKGTTYYWKVVAVDEFGLTTESDVWSFTTMDDDKITINSPADGSTPAIHKDDNGYYILMDGTVTPRQDTSSGCLVKVYSPSDQFLGEWCTDRTLSAGKSYA